MSFAPNAEEQARMRPDTAAWPRHLVVMGVSGTGKTTVATELAERYGWQFIEGDSLHPPGNIAKMTAGIPLDDDDRWPWLEVLASLLAFHHDDGISSVLTCSALKRSYRDALRVALPEGSVFFVHLAAPFPVLLARMESREHFMPPSLLQSQFDVLEPLAADEVGAVFDVSQPVADVISQILEVVSG
jgi:carbohydrate kinase (thermoresistant glucokinase family)